MNLSALTMHMHALQSRSRIRFTDQKISGTALPCCLQNPVPSSCKCYLVKAAASSVRMETTEMKEKAGAAATTAGVTAEKEKSIKLKAKSLSGDI